MKNLTGKFGKPKLFQTHCNRAILKCFLINFDSSVSRNLHKNSQSYLCGNKGTIKLSRCKNRFSNSKRYSRKSDITRAFRYTHVSSRWRAFFPVVFSLSIYSNPLRISNIRWINIDTFFKKKSKAFNLTFFAFSNISWIINSCTSFQWWWLSSILSFYFASFFPKFPWVTLSQPPKTQNRKSYWILLLANFDSLVWDLFVNCLKKDTKKIPWRLCIFRRASRPAGLYLDYGYLPVFQRNMHFIGNVYSRQTV